MAVIAYREMPRNGEFKFGETPELTRRFVFTVDSPGTTTAQQMAQAIQVDIGAKHPEYKGVPCTSISLQEHYEDSPYHIELVARYGATGIDETPNPLLRPSQWKFENFGQQTATFFYYADDGSKQPLTNSAFDFFEGVTTDEAFTKVTISSNIKVFPIDLAAQVTNRINSDFYLSAPPGTYKCQGVIAEEIREVVGTELLGYWAVTISLLYRESGWNLLLPDMGFNFIGGGQKRRVMTFDFENSEFIPSPVPMGLNGNGEQTFGAPAILNRRIYEVTAFNSRFGAPPSVRGNYPLV